MSPRPDSSTMRRAVFAHYRYQDAAGRWVMDCRDCGGVIVPARDRWVAEHDLPRAQGGKDEPPNLGPCCATCDKIKTPKDLKNIAKDKRVSDSVYGVRKTSRPMPHGKHSATKKKMSGEVVRRD